MNVRSLVGPALLLATAFGSWSLPSTAPVVPSVVEAESGRYAIDGGHSTAFFGIRHLGVANFYGRFNTISGEVVLDMDDATNSSIKVSIDPASIDTASKSRDDHVRGEDFLDVENVPLMGFQSTSIEAGEDGQWDVTGKLTLHGKTREISFDAALIGAGETAFGDYRVGLEASFKVLRSDYGMDRMLDKLGDEIRFTLSLEAVRQPG
jgi:polyisoprenoid-binding protein YceI